MVGFREGDIRNAMSDQVDLGRHGPQATVEGLLLLLGGLGFEPDHQDVPEGAHPPESTTSPWVTRLLRRLR